MPSDARAGPGVGSGGTAAATLSTFCVDTSRELVAELLHLVVGEAPAMPWRSALLGQFGEPRRGPALAQVDLSQQLEAVELASSPLDRVARAAEPQAERAGAHRRAATAREAALLVPDELLDVAQRRAGAHDAAPDPRRPARAHG